MRFYLLYKIAQFMALWCPLKASYWIAERAAGLKRLLSKKDTQAVRENLAIIMGPGTSKGQIDDCTKKVFRNFAKYLVDFFRFSRIDKKFVKDNVRVFGKENLDGALQDNKGVILLTAHIGNWELGGVIAALLGYDLYAVALNHKNKKIDRLFKKQREMKGVHVIPLSISPKKCFTVLKENGVLALLGDRSFTKNYVKTDFFGKETPIPRGPAYLSMKIGAPIVPAFFIRLKDDKFILFFEEPIRPGQEKDAQAGMEALTNRYLRVLERVIRTYPEQWYIFRNFWEEIVSWESEF